MLEVHPDNLHYNKKLRGYAGNLRKESTKAEVWLWKFVLRNKQMKGYTFNRQRPVLNYIADFMCKPLMLIIEVDGISHEEELVQEKDVIKSQRLIHKGYTVLRFTDDDILLNLDLVKERISKIVGELEAKS